MIQTLGLNRPEPFPLLQEVIPDEHRWAWHLAKGHVLIFPHPDSQTVLYSSPNGPWDEVTAACQGLVCRGGRVIGRPIRKFFPLGTVGVPETLVENLPRERCLATWMLDGWQMTVYPSVHGGAPMLATKRSMILSPCMPASARYRKMFRAAQWPEGYTPVVEFVAPDYKRTLVYPTYDFYLLALVNITSGEEMDFAAAADYADHNGMKMIPSRDLLALDALNAKAPMGAKGWVLRWDFGGRPLRVGVKG